jgi:signal transduction histidine kinase
VDEDGIEELRQLRFALLVISLLYIVAVALISVWFANETLGPVSRIIEKMEIINTSNLHQRLEIKRRTQDELSRMIQTFNSMLDRLDTSIEAQNQFISNASHELKTPLTSILGEVELALSKPHDEAYFRQSLENIEEDATRMRNIILRLLRLAQTSGSHPEKFYTEVRIDELLMDILEEIHGLDPARKYNIELEALPKDPQQLVIQANRPLLRIALTNVIENAFKFSENKLVTVIPSILPDQIKIAISDQGCGISEADFPYIFDPFFRSEAVRHLPGYGIGLPMVQKIVRLHNGSIEVLSNPVKGTTFVLRIPRRTL